MGNGYYIVKINTKKEPFYLSVDNGTNRVTRVKRASATKLESRGLAEIVSEYFWMSYWGRLKESLELESREVVYVQRKVKKHGN